MSLILVPIESACGFLLVVRVTLDVSSTSIKLERCLFSPTQSLFDAPAQGNQSEFLDETYPTKIGEIGVLTLTVFD